VSLKLHVECYSGWKADERPLRFALESPGPNTPDGGETGARPSARSYEVKEVLDQWYGPDYQCFKVFTDDGNLYILRHDFRGDTWTLDSFRQGSQTAG
jgi:hypothetical protein